MLGAWIKFIVLLWLVIGGAFFAYALVEIMFILLLDCIGWLMPVLGVVIIAKELFK